MPEIYKSTIYDIVKNLTKEMGDKTDKKWEKEAVTMLHEEAEKFLVEHFEQAHEIMKTRNVSTLSKADLHCATKIKQMKELYCVNG